MSITGKLGSTESLLGNIVLGSVDTGSGDVAETLTLVETVTVTRVAVRNINETLVLVGATVAGVPRVYNNSISQHITFYESVPSVTSHERSISETLTLVGDTSVRLPTVFNLTISETLTIAQAMPKLSSYTRTKAETLTLVETNVRGARRNNTLNENLFLDERAFGLVAKYRNKSETLTISETLTHIKVIFRNIQESLIINQGLNSAGNIFGRAVTEVLPLKNGRYLPTRIGNQTIWINPVEFLKASKKCFVLLECAETSTSILLPCPQMGDTEKAMHQQVVKRSMDNVLYTYIRRNNLMQLSYQFLIGRPLCRNLQSFCQVNIDKVITLTNWKGEMWKVYITNNPLEYTGKSLFENEGERWEVPFEFQGVKVFG
jgi:hypothetical protein